jgi:homogentisate 1,2-dioxygenase
MHLSRVFDTRTTSPFVRVPVSTRWFYRIRPAASHGAMKKVEYPFYKSNFGAEKVDPSQVRHTEGFCSLLLQRVGFA